MSHNPGTTHGETTPNTIDWAATAALHLAGDGGGLLDELKAVRHAPLADLVRYIALLAPEKRGEYEIELTGNRRMTAKEIMELYDAKDFPHAV